MATHVVLLRGVNLGSRNRVRMADLRTLLEGLGGEDVRTHLVSGNAVLRSRRSAKALEKAVEAALRDDIGVPVRALVRTSAEMAKAVRSNPFARRGADTRNLHVTFLDAAPGRGRARELMARDFGGDRVALVGREAYLSTPDGYGRSRLGNVDIEKALGVTGTTRNWNTVTALARLAKPAGGDG
ncbi:MAG: hypothetical protein QOE92_1416 [Chloroflexota bacterium]|jgi:uncharacterized protein (DUF1697 family)|nr:hypothetical protein [Chloroflexota bacterium]